MTYLHPDQDTPVDQRSYESLKHELELVGALPGTPERIARCRVLLAELERRRS